MPGLNLRLDRGDGRFVPGEPIIGTVSWDLDESPGSVTVRLYWETSGRGTQDAGVAAEYVFDPAGPSESQDFMFEGIEGPYSFSGKLITLSWKVEAVVKRGNAHAELPITLSPTGEEVRL